MTAIIDIEGIGEVYTKKLKAVGINTTGALLKRCASPQGRKEVAESIDVSPKLVLEWANRADLMRIKGVGTQYSDLLEAAGVDTVRELAQRNATNLFGAMSETNESKKLVRKMPTESQVGNWVEQAKSLPRILSY
jgi:predicted flap endonuclease-1-like 5' DNA nuclease